MHHCVAVSVPLIPSITDLPPPASPRARSVPAALSCPFDYFLRFPNKLSKFIFPAAATASLPPASQLRERAVGRVAATRATVSLWAGSSAGSDSARHFAAHSADAVLERLAARFVQLGPPLYSNDPAAATRADRGCGLFRKGD